MTRRAMLLVGMLLALTSSTDASAGRLSPSLLAKARANDTTPIGVIVRFSVANTTQGRELFKNLRLQLQASLAKLGPTAGFVNEALKKNGVALWLDQSISLKLSPVQARVLASLPIVDEIFENFKVQIPKAVALSAASAPVGPPDHLQSIGAVQTRNAGLKGQGIRIGHLDTGIDPSSPEYQGKILNYAEFNGDGDKIQSSPHDSAQHGTHTAGLLVGNTVGVAPDARLISALVLPNGEGTFAQVIAGMQWVLDPDNNADTNDGANVVSMSLGLPGTYQEFVVPVKNMLKAGVVPVFAIGNFGPTAGSTGSPGNIPDVIGVGAVDQQGQVASFSSRGPVAWTGAYNGTFIKPDVAAPGVAITSSFPGGGYGSLSGSSQAAPITAGAVAVMLGAKPGSSVDTIKNALYQSASNNGQKNNNTGYGLINLPAALAKLGVSVGTPTPNPTPTPAPTPTPPAGNTVVAPAGYTFCAPEGGACNFAGERQAAFGANGRYLSGTATDGFKCTVVEWGSDPVPNAIKACFLKPPTTPEPTPQPSPTPQPPTAVPTGPAGYVLCGLTGQNCNFSGQRQAAFGTNGHYLFGTATDGFKCTVAEWGSDPLPGVAKGCFLTPASTPTPAPAPPQPPATTPTGPAGYTLCSLEGQACSFSGQRQAAFGANGQYLFGTGTDGFNCTAAEWGADPFPGAAKACFTQTGP
ncbi:S8 family peptidase [Deinococcus alpinitundrae]|uniref:S8 family peptidase n=1 Tax=Deinococcus alpinitundrae TaxID=468913 RepID=UPI001ED92C01|nr:S8 family serine peptidase [Deinococcus alpinitundrae]